MVINLTIGTYPTQVFVGFIPAITHYVHVKFVGPKIIKEQYFSVFYTDPPSYYVGRVVEAPCICDGFRFHHIKMKFLKQNLVGGAKTFGWPKGTQKLECVSPVFLFAGPLVLQGNGPFTVKELDKVQKRFEELKKGKY